MSCPRTWISCLFQTDQWRWERLLMRVDMCQHAVKVERRKDSLASEEHCQPHANALPLCLRTHVWNRLHDSRGVLRGRMWILQLNSRPDFAQWQQHLPFRTAGQFQTYHGPQPGFKRPHTFLSLQCDHILSSSSYGYFLRTLDSDVKKDWRWS